MKRKNPSQLSVHAGRWPIQESPRLEVLEDRLPPGDASMGILVSRAVATPDLPALATISESPVHNFASAEATTDGLAVLSGESGGAGRTAVVHRARDMQSGSSDERGSSSELESERPVRRIRALSSASALSAPSITTAAMSSSPRIATMYSPAASVAANPIDVRQAQIPALAAATVAPTETPALVDEDKVVQPYSQLPIQFEPNYGQTDAQVKFLARTSGYTLFLTATEAVMVSTKNSESRIQNLVSPHAMQQLGGLPVVSEESEAPTVVRMQLVGANGHAQITGADLLPGIANYYIGNDPGQWHANIPTFSKVQYRGVYPGIDLVFYSNQGQLEYDFVVSAGADPKAITLNFAGAEELDINPRGDLVVHTAAGDLVQANPVTYQEEGNLRRPVASGYEVEGTRVNFELGAYDASRPLVIDPVVLNYSTFLGDVGDELGFAVAVDQAQNTYVTGLVADFTFPTTFGAWDTIYNNFDAFVTKFTADGSGLVYSTYLGGSGLDQGLGIAVDGSGNAYVTGSTDGSVDFPTTTGAYDTSWNGAQNAFVTKLAANGASLLYSTYLGGSGIGGTGPDYGNAIALDRDRNAYVTGIAYSTDFPTKPGSYDTTHNGGLFDGFVSKIDPTALGTASLVYSTYLGGSGSDQAFDIAVDRNSNAYVTGFTNSTDFPTTPGAFQTTGNSGDAFVTKLNAAGSGLEYSTYLGPAANGSGIAVNRNGNAYVTGIAESANFPTTSGAFDTVLSGPSDAFMTKLKPDGSDLVYSTFLGGSGEEYGRGIGIDRNGNALVTGSTSSFDFPTPGGFQTGFGGGVTDAFVTKLNAGGTGLVYSTYLGGFADDIGYGMAVDRPGAAYVTGSTASSDFPTTPGAFDTTYNGLAEVFVSKLKGL